MSYIAAAIQMSAGSDKQANLERAERLVRTAAAHGATLIVLPETFNWRGKRGLEASIAESITGESVSLMARLAAELKVHIVAGSITERIEGQEKTYNTSVMLGPDGAQMGVYRKIHLFDIDLPGRVTAMESASRVPGQDVVCVATAAGAVGMSICYDLRFPELYRRLTFAGAKILIVPACFTFPTGEAHWESLLRARAIENQCYVIAAAQYGPNIHGYHDYGNSMIIDPWGRVLGRASDLECVVCAPIDLHYLDRVRIELPALTHARLKA
ncbi:MAG TPA: carbon-nitrogen hydrolase family protein [Candidatus Binataceae bacterium]|nr:carbon-nitrogen hydrolase family protein [Candidatus Binataceae bacterium]